MDNGSGITPVMPIGSNGWGGDFGGGGFWIFVAHLFLCLTSIQTFTIMFM